MGVTAGTIGGTADPTSGRLLGRLPRLMPELLAIFACVAVIWLSVALALWQAETGAVQSAQTQTAALARAFAESSERISTVLDRELLAVRANIAEKGDAFDLRQWARTQSSPDHLSLQLAITNRAGLITQDTMLLNTPVDLRDREHFQVQANSEEDAVYISKPVIGRLSKRCAVQYTRKILDREGLFAGIGVNSVSCDDLSHLYDTAGIGDGFVMLMGLDGIIRGYGPMRPEPIGVDLGHITEFEPALLLPEGSLSAATPWDRVTRIISFRRLEQYPLLVLVGYDDERVFHQYWQVRDRAVGIGLAATLIIIGLSAVWIQQRTRCASSRQALVLTLDSMSQGIVMIDADGRIPVVNRRATELLGLPLTLLEPGRKMLRAEALELGLTPWTEESETYTGLLHKGGQIIEVHSQQLPGGGLVRTFTNITERQVADARIRHLAHHDALTGLANRQHLNERIAKTLHGSPAGGVGLLCIDLDGFKAINDALGHEVGDRLLRDVGRRVQGVLAENVLLARTNGDEFAILCPDGPQPKTTEAVAEAVRLTLSEPINIDGTQFRLSASLGVSLHPDDASTAVEMVRHADIAMHEAKKRGRGFMVRFDPEMDRIQRECVELESDLRIAVTEHQLEAWFQPRFETGRLRISGFEALARWRHPKRGFVSPALFIPIAEHSGLIAELGMQMLRDACVFAAQLPEGRIAVNLSPAQFLSDNLPDRISDLLAEHNLSPERLELEITEGVLIADETQALKTLTGLHGRGFQLALDDFGTGYASLSYLRRFPFDRIKIDQSFVREQECDITTRAIIESMLSLAARLRLEVTAEGVETDAQLNLLLEQGCPEVQGFLLGRPMPAVDALAVYLENGATKRKRRLTEA